MIIIKVANPVTARDEATRLSNNVTALVNKLNTITKRSNT